MAADRLGVGCVVAGQASVVHEPAEGALDDPAAGLDAEAAGGRVALDDFEADADLGGEFHGFGRVAVVGPGLGDSGCCSATVARRWVPAAKSWTLAAVTATVGKGRVCRCRRAVLRPMLFLAGSTPTAGLRSQPCRGSGRPQRLAPAPRSGAGSAGQGEADHGLCGDDDTAQVQLLQQRGEGGDFVALGCDLALGDDGLAVVEGRGRQVHGVAVGARDDGTAVSAKRDVGATGPRP